MREDCSTPDNCTAAELFDDIHRILERHTAGGSSTQIPLHVSCGRPILHAAGAVKHRPTDGRHPFEPYCLNTADVLWAHSRYDRRHGCTNYKERDRLNKERDRNTSCTNPLLTNTTACAARLTSCNNFPGCHSGSQPLASSVQGGSRRCWLTPVLNNVDISKLLPRS